MFTSRLIILVSLLALLNMANAQDALPILDKANQIMAAITKKISATGAALDRSTNRYLNKLQRQEEKLRRKLRKTDSTQAKALFGDIETRYAQLKAASREPGKYAAQYSARLDSLSTSVKFLKQLGLGNPEQSSQSLEQVKALQEKLNATEQVRKQIQSRQQLLRDQFAKLGLIKQLRSYQKTAYYYQSQITVYKNLLNTPGQLECKILDIVRQMPQFKDFFARSSMLGQLFPQPVPGSTPSLAGLQTRASVNQTLMQRFGSPQQMQNAVGQSIQSAQSRLTQLRNRVGQGSFGSSTDPDMPDFKPNNQKTRSFLQRLEYSFNAQSQKAKWMFPTTTDLGVQLGYKLNDKSSVGIGMSYKIGWGKNWNQIAITHQGLGLRSYLDWKLKGSFYVSGGYEQNYRSAFKTIDALKDQSAWQSSGLIGINKKYHVSSKVKGEVKLLWDFLSYRQTPKTQAIVVRIGYQLK